MIISEDQSTLGIDDHTGAGPLYLTRVGAPSWSLAGILFRLGAASNGNRYHRGFRLIEKGSERGHVAHLLGWWQNARIGHNVAARDRET